MNDIKLTVIINLYTAATRKTNQKHSLCLPESQFNTFEMFQITRNKNINTALTHE